MRRNTQTSSLWKELPRSHFATSSLTRSMFNSRPGNRYEVFFASLYCSPLMSMRSKAFVLGCRSRIEITPLQSHNQGCSHLPGFAVHTVTSGCFLLALTRKLSCRQTESFQLQPLQESYIRITSQSVFTQPMAARDKGQCPQSPSCLG